jgi:hypothetical protein
MKKPDLTPGEMSKARKNFYFFGLFNVISFSLLSGNIIILYALKLGAGNFLVGILSSFIFLGTFFILIGRLLVPKLGMVKLMGRFWIIRYLMMIPLVAAPLLSLIGLQAAIPIILTASVLGFQISRGIAITSYNPIIGSLTSEKTRGGFLSKVQVIEHVTTLIVGVGMAFLLGGSAPLYIYSFFFLSGILTGIIGARFILQLPEPRQSPESLTEKLLESLVKSLKEATLRKFIINNFLITMLTAMVTPFLIVYMKSVYSQPDSSIVFFTVFGSMGAIFMALVNGFLIDKLGAKPLYFNFTGVLTLVLLPVILSPSLSNPLSIWVFSALIFFFHNMGKFGIINSGQVYFLTAIKAEQRLNLGIIYLLSRGLAGAIGSLLGGVILVWLQIVLGDRMIDVFRVYFGSLALFFIITLFMVNKMESLGAYSIRHTMSVIFSPRDLRAIGLLNRLGKAKTLSQEKDTIRAMAESGSGLTLEEILAHLKSPRFTIRAEALNALYRLPLDEHAVRALLSEVKNQAFTTAYIAADILGVKEIKQGIKILRKQLHSRDYFLVGKCMVALAKLDDRESIPRIEEIVAETSNSRLIIHGASALEIYRSISSIPLLLTKLEKKTSPFLRDEIILSIAGILSMAEWFYPIYTSFLEKSSVGISLLIDSISRSGIKDSRRKELNDLTFHIPVKERQLFEKTARALLESLPVKENNILAVITGALENEQLKALDRLYFLVGAVIIRLYTIENKHL